MSRAVDKDGFSSPLELGSANEWTPFSWVISLIHPRCSVLCLGFYGLWLRDFRAWYELSNSVEDDFMSGQMQKQALRLGLTSTEDDTATSAEACHLVLFHSSPVPNLVQAIWYAGSRTIYTI